ncbi:MAG: hypothetical protein ACHQRM_00580 [Bacteroidia bacterium]
MKIKRSVIVTLAALGICSSPVVKAQNSNPWPISSPVGIGTALPAAGTVLQVVGKPRFDVATTGAGGGRFFFDRPNNSQYECLLSFGTGGTSTYDWVQGTPYMGVANSDYVFAGWTAGRVMTVLQASGNLGIGSTGPAEAPTAKLQVGGDFLVSATGTSGAAYIQHTASGNSSATNPEFTWYGNTNTGTFHPGSNMLAFSNNGVEAMRIGNGTNPFVGIGITNPTQMLHMNNGAILLQGNVSGLGGPQILIGGTAGVQTYGQYGMEYETAAMAGAPNGGLNFWKPYLSTGVNTNNILFLSDNGMVGINTPNPTAQLTVNGTTLIGDPAVVTSLPAGYKLYVQTGILTEKVKVALNASSDWSDYVFEKSYKLRSLEDVKSFVEKNKHLPGVPSASELMEQGGFDIGKMDAKLLEKIEELTLYSVQLKEENKALSDRLAKLEKTAK